VPRAPGSGARHDAAVAVHRGGHSASDIRRSPPHRAALGREAARRPPHARPAERHSAQTLFVEGLPADEILRAARRARADLVVMGTHGRRGVSRLFMGSVAERVVRESRVPVLTVRAPTR